MNVIRNIFARHYAGFFLFFCQHVPSKQLLQSKLRLPHPQMTSLHGIYKPDRQTTDVKKPAHAGFCYLYVYR